MEVSSNKVTQVTISLFEDEATWLQGYLQNSHASEGEKEPTWDYANRSLLLELLTNALKGIA